MSPGQPPVITNQPVNVVNTWGYGYPVVFTSGASGSPAPSFQWLYNGLPLGGATQSSLTLPGDGLTNVGVYAAVAASTSGSATSHVATLSFDKLDTTTDGTPRLTIYGPVGYPYRLDYRNGFSGDYAPLAGFLLTTSPYVFLDRAGKGISFRYYRLYQVLIPRLLGPPRWLGNGTEFRWESETNRVVEIHACPSLSTNAADWVLVTTVTNLTGVVTNQETLPPTTQQRFYKAIQIR